MGEQAGAVGKQEVEFPMGSDLRRNVADRRKQGVAGRLALREAAAQGFHQVAEGQFGIGLPHGLEVAPQRRCKVLQIAVVGKHPVASPQLPLEGVGVLEADEALGRLADVGDHVERMDGIAAYQLGHRGMRAGLGVEEEAYATALEEGDAPAVTMHVGQAAPRLEAGEGEADVRRCIAVHS